MWMILHRYVDNIALICGKYCIDMVVILHSTVSTACEIFGIYFVKLNLTHFSASGQERLVQNHQNQISEQTGHAVGVG